MALEWLLEPAARRCLPQPSPQSCLAMSSVRWSGRNYRHDPHAQNFQSCSDPESGGKRKCGKRCWLEACNKGTELGQIWFFVPRSVHNPHARTASWCLETTSVGNAHHSWNISADWKKTCGEKNRSVTISVNPSIRNTWGQFRHKTVCGTAVFSLRRGELVGCVQI